MSELKPLTSFLATVKKVYTQNSQFKNLELDVDFVSKYNNNSNFAKYDSRFLGAIEIQTNASVPFNYVFPFDKNNIVYPIVGETVVVIDMGDGSLFWLPYSNTQYPNYRQDYATYQSSRFRTDSINSPDYRNKVATGGNANTPTSDSKNPFNPIYEKIKFIQPSDGDTILQGRAGNSIRFTQNFSSNDLDTPSPAIIIRNRQDAALDEKPIGFLAEEDLNKDGSSIYMTSNNSTVFFDKNFIKKKIVAWKDFPNSKKLTGDQIFLNSDRVLLSSKAKEFIIFGKGNTGVITDGFFTIDAEQGVVVSSAGDIQFKTEKNKSISLEADSGGNILIGSSKLDQAQGSPTQFAPIQHMVMGEGLVNILQRILTAIEHMQFATPSGPTPTAPLNASEFSSIKSDIRDLILSNRVWISKQ